MKLHVRSLLVALAAATLAAPNARAQTKVQGIALDQFDPAPVGDAFFGVPSPWSSGHLVPRAAVMFDYAHRPLRLTLDGNSVTTDIVASQGYLRVDASLALWDRLLVAVDLPIALVQSGNAIPGLDFHPPSGPAMGDLRFDARGRLFGNYYDPFQVGLSGSLYVPTGSPDAYTGDGAVRGAFHLLLGGRTGGSIGFVWSAAGGTQIRSSGVAPSVLFGGGAALTFLEERVQVGPELYGTAQVGGSSFMVPGIDVRVQSTTSLEILFGARVRVVSGLSLGAAAGPGVLAVAGTPVVRFVGGLMWSPTPERKPDKPKPLASDRDDDGIRDDVDACPDVKGELQSDASNDGCPPVDRDGDSVLDVEDACPGEAGLRNSDATKNGCPSDTDEDGIADAKDACPETKGAANVDPKKNGCPGDRDGDGIVDAKDACPDTAGEARTDPKQDGCPADPDGDGIKYAADACPDDAGSSNTDAKLNGCPKLARLEGDEIVISQQVRFRSYGKAKSETLDPVSDDLMNGIKAVINAHPEVVKIEVQGHTDDMGTEEFNDRLARERAEAVRQWLIDAGIPAEKLVAKGYGMSKPIADNRINIGRAKNRRVQFVVLERRK